MEYKTKIYYNGSHQALKHIEGEVEFGWAVYSLYEMKDNSANMKVVVTYVKKEAMRHHGPG